MKNERIVRHSLEEIKQKITRGEDETDWARMEGMTEEEIERNALEDNREHGFSDDWYERATPVRPGETAPEMQRVLLRLDRDVLEHFRIDEPGFQARINAALRAFARRQQEGA